MDPQQMIEFIRHEFVRGKAREEIEWILRLNHASEKELAIAFNAAEWQKNQNLPVPASRLQRHPAASVLLIILIILLLASAASIYLTIFQPEVLKNILSNIPNNVLNW